MHIGLCSPDWPPASAANGIVSYVSAVREYFISQGHQVSVISQGRLYGGDGREFSIESANETGGPFDALSRRIGRRIDHWRGGLPGVGRMVAAQVIAAQRIAPIDILEMEESFGWCDMVQRATGCSVVTRLHGPHFLKPGRPRTTQERRSDRQRCRAEGRAIRTARSLTAPTRAIMNAACTQYHRGPKCLSAVIPNPISLSPECNRWSLEACDRDHILMVGRFDYWKGADTMLAAFERLLERRPSTRLTLVGPDMGIETSPGHSIGFEEFARGKLSPRTRERVTFTGKLRPDQIAQLRRNAYVTVVASRWENFPYALLEGFAAGCPMISTAWAGSDEIIDDGETGLLTPVGKPQVLARHLDRLLSNPDTACRIARKGLLRCRNSFSPEAVGSRLLDCYSATLREGTR